MAKIFNGPEQCQQRTITSLCESFLNLNFRKRPTPAFAVSKLFVTHSVLNLVHGSQDFNGPLQAVLEVERAGGQRWSDYFGVGRTAAV